MSDIEASCSQVKLSICIATLNRAAYIGATLESILSQATEDCEVLVLDGASDDGTEQVVQAISQCYPRLRYVRQATNNGIDRDYDRAVQLARGEYCWLMTDDDLLKPGAIQTVLRSLHDNVSLLIVNAEAKDLSMSSVQWRRLLQFDSDRCYAPTELDRLFVDVGEVFKYIGIVIIKRAIWLQRERERYYGTLFIHIAVIFQERLPGEARLIADPLISYRMGNTHTFTHKTFEACMINLPRLVWSFPIADVSKSRVCSAEPWRSIQELILWRGWGYYSLCEYRLLLKPRLRSVREAFAPAMVALLPGGLVNMILTLFYSVTRCSYRGERDAEWVLLGLRHSRFSFRKWS